METAQQHVSRETGRPIPVVVVSFEPELMYQKGARQTLTQELTAAYKELKKDTGESGCVVRIKASNARSGAVRRAISIFAR